MASDIEKYITKIEKDVRPKRKPHKWVVLYEAMQVGDSILMKPNDATCMQHSVNYDSCTKGALRLRTEGHMKRVWRMK